MHGQANEAWALYKSNPSQVSWKYNLSGGPLHSLPKVEPLLLEIHLLEGYCPLEPTRVAQAKPVHTPKREKKRNMYEMMAAFYNFSALGKLHLSKLN